MSTLPSLRRSFRLDKPSRQQDANMQAVQAKQAIPAVPLTSLPMSNALNALKSCIVLGIRTSPLHPQLGTWLRHITTPGPHGVGPAIHASYFINAHPELILLMAHRSTPLSVSALFLKDLSELAKACPRGMDVAEPNPARTFKSRIAFFYGGRRPTGVLDEPEDEGEGQYISLLRNQQDAQDARDGPWPTPEEVEADRLVFNAHALEYKPYAPLVCPCLSCVEERYRILLFKEQHERVRAQNAAHNAVPGTVKKDLLPAFHVLYPQFINTVHEESQALEAECGRLRGAATMLQALHAEEAELLNGDLYFVSEQIIKAEKGEMKQDKIAELKRILPQLLWPAVKAARFAKPLRWVSAPYIPDGPLSEIDAPTAWSHVSAWLGMPGPVASNLGRTEKDADAELKSLQCAEAFAGPAYWFNGSIGQDKVLRDAHLGGPAYEAELRGIKRDQASTGKSSSASSKLADVPNARSGFQLVSFDGGLGATVSRYPLPVVLPLHMDHATAAYAAYCIGTFSIPFSTETTAVAAAIAAASKKSSKTRKDCAKPADSITMQAFIEDAAKTYANAKGMTMRVFNKRPEQPGQHVIVLMDRRGAPQPNPGRALTAAEMKALEAQRCKLKADYESACMHVTERVARLFTTSLDGLTLPNNCHVANSQPRSTGAGLLTVAGHPHSHAGEWSLDRLASLHLPPARAASWSPLGGLKAAHAAVSMMVALGMLPRDPTGHFGGKAAWPKGARKEGNPYWQPGSGPLGEVAGIAALARERMLAEQHAGEAVVPPIPEGMVRLYRTMQREDKKGQFEDVSALEAIPDVTRFRMHDSRPLMGDTLFGANGDVYSLSGLIESMRSTAGTHAPSSIAHKPLDVGNADGPLTHALAAVWGLPDSNALKSSFANLLACLPLPSNMQDIIQRCGDRKGDKCSFNECRDPVHSVVRHIPYIPHDQVEWACDSPYLSLGTSGVDHLGPSAMLDWSAALASVTCSGEAERGGGLRLGTSHMVPNAQGTAWVPYPLLVRLPASFQLGAGLAIHSAQCDGYGLQIAARRDPYTQSKHLMLTSVLNTTEEVETFAACQKEDPDCGAVYNRQDGRGHIAVGFGAGGMRQDRLYGGGLPALSIPACSFILDIAEQAADAYAWSIEQLHKASQEAVATALEVGAAMLKRGERPPWPPVALEEGGPFAVSLWCDESEDKGAGDALTAPAPLGKGGKAEHAVPIAPWDGTTRAPAAVPRRPLRELAIDPRLISPTANGGTVQLMSADNRHQRKTITPLGWQAMNVLAGSSAPSIRSMWPAAFAYEPVSGPSAYLPWSSHPVAGNPLMFTGLIDALVKTVDTSKGGTVSAAFAGVPASWRSSVLPMPGAPFHHAGTFEKSPLTQQELISLTSDCMQGKDALPPALPANVMTFTPHYYDLAYGSGGDLLPGVASNTYVDGGDEPEDDEEEEEEEEEDEAGAAAADRLRRERLHVPAMPAGLLYGSTGPPPDAHLPVLGLFGKLVVEKVKREDEEEKQEEEETAEAVPVPGGSPATKRGDAMRSKPPKPDSRPTPADALAPRVVNKWANMPRTGARDDINDADNPCLTLSLVHRFLAANYTRSQHMRSLVCTLGLTEREGVSLRMSNMAKLASQLGLHVTNGEKVLSEDARMLLPISSILRYATGQAPFTLPDLPPSAVLSLLDIRWAAVPGPETGLRAEVEAAMADAVAARDAISSSKLRAEPRAPGTGAGAVVPSAAGIPDPLTDPAAYAKWLALPGSMSAVPRGGAITTTVGRQDEEEADVTFSDEEQTRHAGVSRRKRHPLASSGASAASSSSSEGDNDEGCGNGYPAIRRHSSRYAGAGGKEGAGAGANENDDGDIGSAGSDTDDDNLGPAGSDTDDANEDGEDEDDEDEDEEEDQVLPSAKPSNTKTSIRQPAAVAPASAKVVAKKEGVIDLNASGRPKRASTVGVSYKEVHVVIDGSDDEEKEGAGRGKGGRGRAPTESDDEDAKDGAFSVSSRDDDEQENDDDDDAGFSDASQDEEVAVEDEEEKDEGGGGAGGYRAPRQKRAARAPRVPSAHAAVPGEGRAVKSRTTSSKVSKCQVPGCDQVYANPLEWEELARLHMSEHHSEVVGDDNACQLCGVTGVWGTRKDKNRHEGAHTAAFPCTHPGCESAFTREDSLNAHLKKHAGVLFPCSHCPFKATQKSSLTRHMLTHDVGEKPAIACTQGCGQVFKRKSTHDTHVEVVHKGRRFGCVVVGCVARMKKSTQCAKHIQVEHSTLPPAEAVAAVQAMKNNPVYGVVMG